MSSRLYIRMLCPGRFILVESVPDFTRMYMPIFRNKRLIDFEITWTLLTIQTLILSFCSSHGRISVHIVHNGA